MQDVLSNWHWLGEGRCIVYRLYNYVHLLKSVIKKHFMIVTINYLEQPF